MRVPTYQTQQQEIAAPTVQQNPNVSSAAFGAPIAQGLANAANAFQQMADDADNLRVQEAYNQLRERQLDLEIGKEGFSNIKGRDVMTPRKDGKSLSDDYLERFDSVGREIESSLANDRQRQKFRQKFGDSALSFRAGLQKHEAREIGEYAKTVTNATVALETETALKSWNSPDVVTKSVTSITESLQAQGLREGMPADALKVVVADKVSKLHAGVLAMALENQNLGYASDYLKQYGKDMNSADVLKVKGQIDKEMEAAEAVTVAGKVWNNVRSAVEPDDMERLNQIQFGVESGNRQVDDKGNPITSPKGAVGIAQVMEATGPEAAKLAGLPWDRERWLKDKDYNKAIGVAYRNEMLKRFGGDLNKALAAYNAGPGAVEKAIANAEKMKENAKLDPTLPVKSWLDLLPKETQDYVSKVTKSYASGIGGAKRATLEDVQAQVRAEMVGKPAYQVKMAVDHATNLYETNQKARKQREDDTYSEAMKYVDLYEGDLTKMPASVRMNLRGDQLDNLQNYAAKRAKGIEPATDWSVYYDLRRDPEVLKKTNLIAFRHVLGESEFKTLVNEQENLRSGKAESVTATRSATQVLNSFLTEAGIDPSPKPSDKPDSDAARVGRAMRAQTELIEAAERSKGRKLTPDEITQETAKLFTNFEVKGSWFGTNTKPRFDVSENDKVVVPQKERDLIVAALQATKRPVTEDLIRAMYLRKNNLPGK